jgi:hypothetical protein
MTATLLSVVFQDSDEVSPPNLSRIPPIPLAFQHPFHIQVFHEHGVVFAGVEGRDFVL